MTQRVCGHLRKAHDPEPAEGERVRLLLESLGAWQLPGVRAMLCRCGVSTAYIYIYVLKMIIYAYLDVCLNKVTDLYINNMHLLDSDIFISFMVQSTVFDSLHWHEWL